MFLIFMLHQLAQVSERLRALIALVRILRDPLITSPIRQKGRAIEVLLHTSLCLGILVNLLPSIIAPLATRTETALHVLNCVRRRAKTNFPTNGACDVTRTMNLLMHIKLILRVEVSVTHNASKGRIGRLGVIARRILRPIDTILATRVAVALPPLVAVKTAIRAPISTVGTVPSHVNPYVFVLAAI